MPILNKDSYYFVNHDGSLDLKTHGGYPVTTLHNWDEHNYWIVEFIGAGAISSINLENIIPANLYQNLLNGSLKLLLSHVSEAYHAVVDLIYQHLVIEQKLPTENIVLVTNSADIQLEIDLISKKYNLPHIKSKHMMSFEYDANKNLSLYTDHFTIKNLQDKTYNKKYISLNGLWRPHRLLLVSFLKSLNVLNDGFVSLNCVPCDLPTMDFMFPIMLEWSKNNIEGTNLLLSNEQEIKTISKIYVDNIDNTRPSYTSLDKRYYENSYFSIVSETLCWATNSGEGLTLGRALSEKTFKPILFKHPFMLLAVPKSLELLKDLGYKTFSECIDESYDNEYDDSKRVYMVAKEAERLCNLKENELKDFLKTCREITDHNFNVLRNKNNFIYDKT